MFAIVLLACLMTLGLPGQDPFELGRPALRTYGMEDGLPGASIYCLTLDSKGRLWTGTVDGAATFTGKGWIPLRMPKESPSNFIRAILETRDGSMWFGTQDGGLWRLRNGFWSHYKGGRELPSNRINCLAETLAPTGESILWVGTGGGGIARFTQGQWRKYGPKDGLSHTFIWRIKEIIEPNGRKRIWSASQEGLAFLDGQAWKPLEAKDGFTHKDVNDLLDVEESPGKRVLWAALWGKGMARWDGRSWTYFTSENGFQSRFPTSSLGSTLGRDGRRILWAGTYDAGLWRFENGRWQGLTQARGFPTIGIHAILPAPQGKPTLWIGTRGGGVTALDLGGWRTLDDRLGLPSLEASCFGESQDSKGKSVFWIGTNHGLARFQKDQPPESIQASNLPSDYILSLLPTRDSLWVGTLKGLARKDASGWTSFGPKDGLPEGMAICLLETNRSQGNPKVWLGTMKGLACRENNHWRMMTTQDGLPHDYVVALCETLDEKGEASLWVGTRGGGVGRLFRNQWSRYGESSGLTNLSTYCLHETRGPKGESWLWAGTLGAGLARMNLRSPGRWEVFTTEQLPSLPSNYIQRIEEDAQGRLYLSTASGVARLHLDWQKGIPEPSRMDTFTLGDGLPGLNCNLGASLVDSLGRIWMGTSRGAAVLDPKEETTAPPPPFPILERAFVTGSERELVKNEAMNYRDRHLMFEFSLPSLHRKEDTRYQTQLLGLEPHPSKWQKEGFREFPTLPSGSYVLRVWARDFSGQISGPLEFPFQVKRPPWRHPLAYLAYLGLLSAGIVYVFRRRTQVLQERTRELEAAVRQRTRVIEQQSTQLEHSNWELQSTNTELKASNDRNLRLIQELQAALAEVKTLRGFIPICAYCKKIRDDQGYWDQIEHYICERSEAQFSHGICPECKHKLMEEMRGLKEE